MERRSKTILAVAVVVAALFVSGLVEIFMLGHKRGDIYPPYSSYRSDPLGVRALYDSLGSLEGISVRRNVEPIVRLKEGRGKTLFFCGATRGQDPKEAIDALEGFVARGGRLVIAFFPTKRVSARKKDVEAKEGEKRPSGREEGARGPKEESPAKREPWSVEMVSIEERWGFSTGFSNLPAAGGAPKEAYAEKRVGERGLPPSLKWHSTLVFEELDEPWRTVYSMGGPAVIARRSWGEGTIVLVGDSFLLSNEAMREERYPAVLAWLVGASTEVLFDETHLGIRERPGIMALVRRYGLEPILFAMALLAALFVWRSALSLVPKRRETSPDGSMPALGRDLASGLVNLMQRSIPPKEILFVCWREWKSSRAGHRRLTPDRERRIVELLEKEKASALTRRDPAAAYKNIHEILTKRAI